ncbi:hypothetical protein [Planktothrix agardhii]|uniref:hypothetical protein n=1 Tax=Planktothrix agardhii TaxID=1160 RepID=UPI0020B32A80|nr:hypothetical protein [Planktothrix agardhii]CAD5986251.1 hypothetical protein PCC7811_04677 [Planktothrix agardhii]CAD5986326.1 hypothetical protein PCC7811_04692 [Planktothrix agardhii]
MPRQNFSKIETLPENDLKKIQSLARNGYSFKYIFSWLQETGFKIAEKTVQNWHKKYLESIASDDDKAKQALKAIDKQDRDTSPNPLIDNPKDLERIRKEWDIPDIKILDTNPEMAIGASQKLAYDLFISVGILTKNRLNLHQKGEAKFPIEQIKALKLLYEIYAPLLGVNELVSPNAAIKSLESYGYNLEGLKKVNYDETAD